MYTLNVRCIGDVARGVMTLAYWLMFVVFTLFAVCLQSTFKK